MYDVLEPGADGWLRGGEPWEPTQPFYAVLGDPIAHSLSPAMQNAALREREIEAEYLAGPDRRGPAARPEEGSGLGRPGRLQRDRAPQGSGRRAL